MILEVSTICWGTVAEHLNMHGSGQERTGGRNSVVWAIRLNIFSSGGRFFCAETGQRGGHRSGGGGQRSGLAIRPMPARKAAIDRLLDRRLERKVGSATVTRAERAVTERGIGLCRLAPGRRWQGRAAGRVERESA